ncbi:MAG: DUF1501 domain-containing protein [Planctomycetes bacterium]|nr:DUF1501 domain-containing protein [Planctomycetota bacterium]
MTCSRRAFVSGIARGGLFCTLPWWQLARASQQSGRDRALIFVFLDGGLSHIDTFDGKPGAPADVRSGLETRETKVPGIFVSTELSRIAGLMDRCALVRTLTSGEGNHDRAARYLLTGRKPSPVLEYPGLGAVHDVLRERTSALPAFVSIPDTPIGAGAGFTGAEHAAFETGSSVLRPGGRVNGLVVPAERRRALALADAFDQQGAPPSSHAERAAAALRDRARAMTDDTEVRAAFSLEEEPRPARERYGNHDLGRACLLARRLVERGTRIVLVRDRGWDMHAQIAHRMTYGFPAKLPGLDLALSALIEDLDERSLSDRVSVVLVSEFGRTPRVNPSGGRDHWPRVHSSLWFGAGVRRGIAVGTSDPRGEEPIDRPVSPGEFHATVAQLLGLPLDAILHSPDGRPHRLVEPGVQPVSELLVS